MWGKRKTSLDGPANKKTIESKQRQAEPLVYRPLSPVKAICMIVMSLAKEKVISGRMITCVAVPTKNCLNLWVKIICSLAIVLKLLSWMLKDWTQSVIVLTSWNVNDVSNLSLKPFRKIRSSIGAKTLTREQSLQKENVPTAGLWSTLAAK